MRMKYSKDQILADKEGAIKEKKSQKSDNCLLLNKTSSSFIGNTTPHIIKNETTGSGLIKAIGNTFNYFDSDADVLTPKCCNKTLADGSLIYHLKNHKFDTDGIIGKMERVYVDDVFVPDLNQNVKALIFESDVDEMKFDYYSKQLINQHSIGFNYSIIELAANDDDPAYKAEKALWDSYIDQIINKEEAVEYGYFWKVSEIYLREISAVLLGANRMTPTIDFGKNEDDMLNILKGISGSTLSSKS